jgi:multiple sugar transport system permease protein
MSTMTERVRSTDVPPERYVAGRASGGTGRTARRVVFWLALIVLAFVFVAPLIWMLITSFKTPDAATSSYKWWPNPFDTSSYDQLLHSSSLPVLRWFVNSLLAGLANAVIIVVVDSMAAYALARMEFFGKRPIFAIIIATIFLPVFVFLVPNFLIVSKLGWLDSLWAIIVPSAGGAFGVFFLRQFFLSLPTELEEAARIDGANTWTIFTKVVLPLSRPALATLGVLSFLTNFNDFIWPIYVLFSPDQLTMPAGLSTLQNSASTNYPLIMAGAVIASVPAIILFIIAQRQIIEGVSRSGLKG